MLPGRTFNIRTRRHVPERQVRKRERQDAKMIMMSPMPMGRARTTIALFSEVIDPLLNCDARLACPLGEP